MNKRISLLVSILLFLLILTGCPYNSRITLSDASDSKIDSLLIGKWYAANEKWDDEILAIEIVEFNEHEYSIDFKHIKNGSVTAKAKLRAFASTIKDKTIMNVYGTEEEDEICFFQYELINDHLILTYVSDKFIKTPFKSREELLKFFEENLDNDAFFEDEIGLDFKQGDWPTGN